MSQIIIRVTTLQMTLVPTRDGGFVGSLAATLTGEPLETTAARPQVTLEPPSRSDVAMSDAQRRMLWRLATQLGHRGEEAAAFLRSRLGVRDLGETSKSEASRLISALEMESRGNGKESGDA